MGAHVPRHNRAGSRLASGLGWIRQGNVITGSSDWLRANLARSIAHGPSHAGRRGGTRVRVRMGPTASESPPRGTEPAQITKWQKSNEAQIARCKVASAGCKVLHDARPARPGPQLAGGRTPPPPVRRLSLARLGMVLARTRRQFHDDI
jgi:hypothetical protein